LGGRESAGDAQQRRAVGEGVFACRQRGIPFQLSESLPADRGAARVGEDFNRAALWMLPGRTPAVSAGLIRLSVKVASAV
jgi:hypothetical protein